MEASCCTEEEHAEASVDLPMNFSSRGEICLSSVDEELPLVGLNAMERANSTLEDFLDITNERSLQSSLDKMNTPRNYVNSMNLSSNRVEEPYSATNTPPPFMSNAFDPLLFLLQRRGLLTKQIQDELETGLEYWALERKLCHALISRKKILLEDVMRAIQLKSFDYRVLHLLLCRMRDAQVNELHMEFLSVSELLVEIADDLELREAAMTTRMM